MIEQAVSVFQQTAPILLSLIVAAFVMAISIWLDADAYHRPRR